VLGFPALSARRGQASSLFFFSLVFPLQFEDFSGVNNISFPGLPKLGRHGVTGGADFSGFRILHQ